MTQRLYEQDSFCRTFTATVLSCMPVDGGYAVVLDRTAFFPEGGGQAADGGMLDGVPVLDVQLADDEIVHTMASPLPVGSVVNGELDWAVRFSRMQKHTGEHIVCGIIHRLYGLTNVGFHLGSEDVTLDLDGELTREQLDDIEERANRIVAANVAVTATYPPADELAAMDYRSKKAIDGAVRIVTIAGYDRCACCAPHVSATGQVGLIKLLDFIRYKGGIRIHMQCGMDALADYRMRYTQTAAVAAMLSVKQTAVTQGVERLLAQREGLTHALRMAQKECLQLRLAALPSNGGRQILVLSTMEGDLVRELALAGSERCGDLCAVFAGDDASGYMFAAAGGALTAFGAALRQTLFAKGGGSAQCIQGRVSATAAQLQAFWQSYN